ncbi:outer membrane protein [Rhizobium paknamense]|uniref:Opacity protein-like surface antigen n=1 Tax=Rhizobium paknamense TaxID=1206817 RepID=A0ABU0IFQ2_9HYPH|nr:outer membrane protein [Rhizobium paknamense]MDQ0457068.1 opacity protein-like surface antigen [Rhizobium paknamense]
MKSRILGLMFALSAMPAMAADLYQPEPPPPVEAPEVRVSDVASGWYLRGDVGYSFNKLRGAHYFQGSNASLTDFTKADLDDSFWGGAGVGYQINSHLRTDLTFDYLGKADFSGSTHGSCGVSTACTSRDLSSLQAYTLMANAYVDLGTYASITPYVGAGIGGSYVKWDKLKNTACADDGSGCDGTVTHDGKGSWRFAYQVMVGASVDITCDWKADAGYRFRHTLSGDMFGYRDNGGPGSDKGFYSHQLYAGARYQFGGCPQPVAYEPPPQPMVYK